MNQNQPLWVRITHHSQVTDQVEVTEFRGAIQTIYESFVDAQHRKVQMVVEVSNQPFQRNSLLSREQELEQSIMSQTISDPNTIMYLPDVTLAECQRAWSSPEGELMFKYQRAENRIGVDADTLNEIKSRYESNWPRVAPHGPHWGTL